MPLARHMLLTAHHDVTVCYRLGDYTQDNPLPPADARDRAIPAARTASGVKTAPEVVCAVQGCTCPHQPGLERVSRNAMQGAL